MGKGIETDNAELFLVPKEDREGTIQLKAKPLEY